MQATRAKHAYKGVCLRLYWHLPASATPHFCLNPERAFCRAPKPVSYAIPPPKTAVTNTAGSPDAAPKSAAADSGPKKPKVDLPQADWVRGAVKHKIYVDSTYCWMQPTNYGSYCKPSAHNGTVEIVSLCENGYGMFHDTAEKKRSCCDALMAAAHQIRTAAQALLPLSTRCSLPFSLKFASKHAVFGFGRFGLWFLLLALPHAAHQLLQKMLKPSCAPLLQPNYL